MYEIAEQYAHPSYKWIGEKRLVKNIQNWQISNYPGGIGFSLYNYSHEKALKVILKVYREDKTCEYYIMDTYYCGEYGDEWQKWETNQLPLFPYESCHGNITYITFSYLIHKGGQSIPSFHDYKFALKSDFDRGWIHNDDFHDVTLKEENNYFTYEMEHQAIQNSLNRINDEYEEMPILSFFTRGNIDSPDHPIREIHWQIDRVIDKKNNDPQGRHYIVMAIFDFENIHFAEHLIHAKKSGVEVECIADWSSVSSLNCSEDIARMRHAGIPIYGVVRNIPCDPSGGIASMHTKIIIFDDEVVHSSSYNLHFHLWGGNWENALFYYSKDFALLYLNIYHTIRGGNIQRLGINPSWRYNLYYSFGRYYTSWRDCYRLQDAIITEINHAKASVVIVMFDIEDFTGFSSHDELETDVITALIHAKQRGVKVKLILNGMITHTGELPELWDKDAKRPLKENVLRLKNESVEIDFIYYWESIYSPLHHKYAVFDNHTVITGSFNWYEASLYCDDVISVIRDEKIANEFLTEATLVCKKFRVAQD